MLWLCWWVELAIVNNSSCHKAAICIKYEFFFGRKFVDRIYTGHHYGQMDQSFVPTTFSRS